MVCNPKSALKSLIARIDPMASCALEIGMRLPLSIRRENLKEGLGNRILYISDIHLTPRRLPLLCAQLKEVLQHAAPNLTLLGGDIVDSHKGIAVLPELLKVLVGNCDKIGAVGGNHDLEAGLAEVKCCLQDAGVTWLPDSPIELVGPSQKRIHIFGNRNAALRSDGFNILCEHDPVIFSDPSARRFDLVLAGHYHGGQIVLFEHQGRLFPNSWIYPWSGNRFVEGNSTLLVSRGVSDTLPIRFNCPREVILCEL